MVKGGSLSKTLRQEHTAHTRRALIEAATRLFTERGYLDTSIEDVASGARVTRGALYHHFSSKLEMFNAVCDAVDASVVDRVRAAAAHAGTAEERMRGVLDAYFEASRDPTYRAVVLGEAYKAQAREDGRRYTPAMSKLVGEFVCGLVEAGQITAEDPDMLRRLLCATLYEVASAAGEATYTAVAEEYAKKAICHMLFGGRPPN
jgi:AcrR family transcriptional regulator